jgi:hypothetical protein
MRSEKNILTRNPRLSRNVFARETRKGKTWFSRLEGDINAIVSCGRRAWGNTPTALQATMFKLMEGFQLYSN